MRKRGRSRHPVFDSSDTLLDGRAEAELDLHGFSAAEAPAAVRAFVAHWQRRKPGAVVQIITGKGTGSPNGPVLRGLVKSLLQGELRALVTDWRLDDGEGAYKVKVR